MAMDEVTITIVESTEQVEVVVREPGTPVFGASIIKTLSSGVVAAGARRNLVIAAETGTADDMIELTGLSKGEEVLLRAKSGHTITIKHNNGAATVKMLIFDNADFILDEDHPVPFVLVDTNKLAQKYDETAVGGGVVMESDYDANTILQATADNTPVAITVAEQRLLGRITGGNITALTKAQIRTLLVLAESDSVKFLDVDTTELSNKSGILKIQPDVQGDVELFGDTNVADNVDGKSLIIHRKAAEGDNTFKLFIDQFQIAKLESINSISFVTSGSSMLFDSPDASSVHFRSTTSFKTKLKLIQGDNAELLQYGNITAAAGDKYISWQVDDATDKFRLAREDANILAFVVDMPLEVNGGVQIGTDTDGASAAKVGTTRYRADANNSWMEMVMQTGSSTYAWVVIKTNNW